MIHYAHGTRGWGGPRRTAVRGGMTLIEVMVAVSLATLLLYSLHTGMTTGTKLTYSTTQRMVAFGLCKDTLERMRGAAFKDVTASNFFAHPVRLTHMGNSSKVPLNGVLNSTITDRDDPPRKDVTVTVAWSFMGHPFSESVQAVIYKKE